MVEQYFIVFLIIQLAHSIEELSTGFYKKFPLFKMSFRVFLLFEVLFLGFWTYVLLAQALPYRQELMAGFALLMFANGLWHVVWWGIEKKYVPGLVTAPLFIITYLIFYFQVVTH